MRRSPLQRHTPLANTTPLHRYTPLAQVSPRRATNTVAAGKRWLSTMKPSRRKPAVSTDTRAVLIERSKGWCEIQMPGCLGRGTDPAHRISVKVGGRHGEAATRHDVPSNALWACRACHDRCHAYPADAYDLGLMLREGEDPQREPVIRRGVPVYLDNAGGVYEFDEVGP